MLEQTPSGIWNTGCLFPAKIHRKIRNRLKKCAMGVPALENIEDVRGSADTLDASPLVDFDTVDRDIERG